MRIYKQVIFLFFAFLQVHAQEIKYRKIDKENVVFQPGEKLVYKVKYGWVTAGTATFEIAPEMYKYKNRLCYKFHGEGRSAKSFDWFYKVRDLFDSYVDAEGIFPHYYVREVNEGDFHYYDRVEFDHVAGKIKGKQGIFKASPYTQDMLSSFYYARTINFDYLKPGDTYYIDVFLDDNVYKLGMYYLGKEEIETKFGKMRCLKVAPLLVAGRVFKGEKDMIIWITDDKNKIPVRIESPVIIGRITAELIKAKGLKFPMEAKVKKRK